MRALYLGGILGLVLAAWPALAQQQASSFLTGVNPSQLNFKPIDTSKAMRGASFSKAMQGGSSTGSFNQAFQQPGQRSGFGMSRLFPKITLGNWPPKFLSMPILSQKNNPYQPNPLAGKNPFDQPKKK